MQPFKVRDFIKILERNGYHLDRTNGSHATYTKKGMMPITINTKEMNTCIAHRLIKENKLNLTGGE